MRARVPVRCACALLRAVVPGSRLDEASAGDLVALEAQAAGMEGMVIWGLHRDTADIRAIGLPVFSLGAIPTGPLRLDARAHDALASAVVGDWAVSCEDLVLGDDDGVLFLPSPQAEEIFTLAETISDTEQHQPNGSGQVSHCAARYSSAPTLQSARKRPPSAFASICARWAGP
jgi:regulator of RNase E activity RraA